MRSKTTVGLNGWFPYRTYKQVEFRDFRLGSLHIALCVGVFLYVVVYQIIVAKKYLAYAPISGSVRVQAEGPQSYLPVSAVPYCAGNVDSFIPASHRSVQTTHILARSPLALHRLVSCRLPCLTWDELSTTSSQGAQAFFATTVKVRQQELQCAETAYGCLWTASSPQLDPTSDVASTPCATEPAGAGRRNHGSASHVRFSDDQATNTYHTYFQSSLEQFVLAIAHDARVLQPPIRVTAPHRAAFSSACGMEWARRPRELRVDLLAWKRLTAVPQWCGHTVLRCNTCRKWAGPFAADRARLKPPTSHPFGFSRDAAAATAATGRSG